MLRKWSVLPCQDLRCTYSLLKESKRYIQDEFQDSKKTTPQITALQEFYGKIKKCGVYTISAMAIPERRSRPRPDTNKGGANRNQEGRCDVDSRWISRADPPGGLLSGLARALAAQYQTS